MTRSRFTLSAGEHHPSVSLCLCKHTKIDPSPKDLQALTFQQHVETSNSLRGLHALGEEYETIEEHIESFSSCLSFRERVAEMPLSI